MKIALIAAAFASTLFAQVQGQVLETQNVSTYTTSGPTGEKRFFFYSVGGQQVDFVSGINVGPTVTKAPYAAEAVTEFIQTLYDGNRIVERSSTKQYRDSEGRERREEGSPLNVVFITDPVAKLSLTLHPESKTAEKSIGSGQVSVGMVHVATPAIATRNIRTAPPTEKGTLNFTYASRTAAPGGKEEDLGTRTMEGVEAKGTRTTTTIAAGEIGNDRPIDIVDERWYSPELQLNLLTRHADPRTGENTYKLINIQRLEQVRSLFEIPPGYTIHEPATFTRAIKEE